MNIQQAKTISLVNLMAQLGHQPTRIYNNGQYYWYRSPHRDDKKPSFIINTHNNTFYDKATGEGGNIIKLGMLLCDSVDITETLRFIEKTANMPQIPINKDIKSFTSSNGAKIHKIRPLQNLALVKYLKSRGIKTNIAKRYLQEIYYYPNGSQKQNFAVAFKSNSGGYEVRNKYYKGCLGTKDVTAFDDGFRNVSVFEGFTDFLSLLCMKDIEQLKSDTIVLNSVTLINRATQIIKDKGYQKIFTFLDNDEAGHKAQLDLNKAFPIIPMNHIYQPYKDLNEKRKATTNL